MRILLYFLLFNGLLISNVRAQLHLGFTADFGNDVDYSPDAETFLKAPRSFSGSLFFYVKESINDSWGLKYGASAGVLGYTLRVHDDFDTLSISNNPEFYTVYPNYTTLYASSHLSFGKRINIFRKLPPVEIYLGGGLTYYFEAYQSGSSSRRCSSNSVCETIFEYEILRTANNIKGFIELSAETYIIHRLSVGLRYRQHLSPALEGTYHLYHVNNPLGGAIELTQRAISIVLAYDIKRIKIPKPRF